MFFIHYKTVFLIRECFCYFIMIEAKYNSMISVRHGKCRMRSGKVLDSDANLLSTYVGCVMWKRTLYPSLKCSLFHTHTHTHTLTLIIIYKFSIFINHTDSSVPITPESRGQDRLLSTLHFLHLSSFDSIFTSLFSSLHHFLKRLI